VTGTIAAGDFKRHAHWQCAFKFEATRGTQAAESGYLRLDLRARLTALRAEY
jgi:hypothetical protein